MSVQNTVKFIYSLPSYFSSIQEITIITKTISVIVISSNKIILKKIIPKIEVVEHNKKDFTRPNNFNVITKNNVAIPIPANGKNNIRMILFRLILNWISKITRINNLKIQDTNKVIGVIIFASILSPTHLERLTLISQNNPDKIIKTYPNRELDIF